MRAEPSLWWHQTVSVFSSDERTRSQYARAYSKGRLSLGRPYLVECMYSRAVHCFAYRPNSLKMVYISRKYRTNTVVCSTGYVLVELRRCEIAARVSDSWPAPRNGAFPKLRSFPNDHARSCAHERFNALGMILRNPRTLDLPLLCGRHAELHEQLFHESDELLL
jgi:hypothetical protein